MTCSFIIRLVQFFYGDFSHFVTIDTGEAGGFPFRLLLKDALQPFAPQSDRGDDLSNSDELLREIDRLRDCMSRLSAASLRINASLDLDTVLGEVVEGARVLTGSDYGLITTVDDSGHPRGLVSSGFSPEMHEGLANWADGPRLFEHFRELPGMLRLSDGPTYIRSLGFSTDLLPSGPFLGTPMRHRGVLIGHFFLVKKAGVREFTGEDQETLMLFASQAATAIANARAYQDEHRARADLEALVDTSPVGVAVFDARTGQPVSFNREAQRIVKGLRTEGQPPEQLMEVITCRRADGQEVSLPEFQPSQVFRNATAVRAEEVVLSVPDGRSVKTLINATPIHGEDGAVVSVVVTMQDLAPLEELERSRTEFLSLVSHELRAPLISIKGAAATVLDASSVPDPSLVRQFFRIIDEQANLMHGLISDLLDTGRIETGTLSVSSEPVAPAVLVDQARNTFLSGGGRHALHIDLPLDLPRVLADRERIAQVLNNLFSNAARHAPESSPIRVSAVRDGVYVAISVADEGRGVPPEQLPHLFRKHTRGGDEGGTGLGLSICKGLVEAHGGRIRAESGGVGLGTRITFTIPVAEGSAPGAVAIRAGAPGQEPEPPRILVVDDDPQTLRDVRDTLAAAGYAPLVTGDPQEVPRLLDNEKPALVLLDLMLPGIDGIQLLKNVPGLTDLPVIFLSAYGRDETISRALEMGAADYIVKPFSPTELTARVRAALRRQSDPEPFRLGALAIDYAARRVTVNGRPLKLTATEYDLLRVLAVNAGRVVTHTDLLRQVWRRHNVGNSAPVRAFVKKLRNKLGDDAASPTYISSVRRIGYRMAQPSKDSTVDSSPPG